MQGNQTTPGSAVTVQPVAPAAVPVSPTLVYRGAVARRDAIRSSLERLEDRRGDLSRRLTSTERPLSGVDRAGVEKALVQLDEQIAVVNKDLADAEGKVAQSAAVPGTSTTVPREARNEPPEEAFVIAGLFIMAVFLPLSIAFARRIWKRSEGPKVGPIPADVSERLARLEQAVESVAIEMERVGEGQRFVTQLLAEGPARSLPNGAVAEPLSAPARERAKESR